MLRNIPVTEPWREKKKFSFKLKTRLILDTIISNLENELILGLMGSRQVGKSSILYLLIDHLIKKGVATDNIYYFNLDDFKLQEIFSSIPEFIEFIGKGDEKKYVFWMKCNAAYSKISVSMS